MQPFVTGLGGFAVAPRDIPVFNSAAFNFTFEFGAGVEMFQTHTRSCQLEYRYHHLCQRWQRGACQPRDRFRRIQSDAIRSDDKKNFLRITQ